MGESAATTSGPLDDLVREVDAEQVRRVAGLAAAALALVVAAQALAVRRLGLA
jgi:hypothetical protein